MGIAGSSAVAADTMSTSATASSMAPIAEPVDRPDRRLPPPLALVLSLLPAAVVVADAFLSSTCCRSAATVPSIACRLALSASSAAASSDILLVTPLKRSCDCEAIAAVTKLLLPTLLVVPLLLPLPAEEESDATTAACPSPSTMAAAPLAGVLELPPLPSSLSLVLVAAKRVDMPSTEDADEEEEGVVGMPLPLVAAGDAERDACWLW